MQGSSYVPSGWGCSSVSPRGLVRPDGPVTLPHGNLVHRSGNGKQRALAKNDNDQPVLEDTTVGTPQIAGMGFRWLAALSMAAILGGLMPARSKAQELTVGVTGTTSDAPYFIADKKGFFKDEGLTVRFIQFDSAAKMIAPLGAGQLDIGGGATSAALYNAVKREVNIKIVGDKARNSKDHGFQSFLVRKALHDTGKITSPKDLKGVKVAMSAPGNSEAVLVDGLLKKAGCAFKDVERVYLGVAQHPVAVQNGAGD